MSDQTEFETQSNNFQSEPFIRLNLTPMFVNTTFLILLIPNVLSDWIWFEPEKKF